MFSKTFIDDGYETDLLILTQGSLPSPYSHFRREKRLHNYILPTTNYTGYGSFRLDV